MFAIKRVICINKGDKSKFIFTRLMPFLDLELLGTHEFKCDQRPYISDDKQPKPSVGTRMWCSC